MIQKETHFAEGIIESVLTLERAFLVKSENEIKKLVLTENSNIWKGLDGMDIDVVAVGDHFYARGYKQNDDLFIENIWINIVNVSGIVEEVSDTEIDIRLIGMESRWKVKLMKHTRMLDSEDNVIFRGAKVIQKSNIIQVVGVRNPGSDHILASTIFLQSG